MVENLLAHLTTCGSTAFDVFCDVLYHVNPGLSNHLRLQARSSPVIGK